MAFEIATYIRFLDEVIGSCCSVRCLTPAANAVTRRAKTSYRLERDSLLKLASRHHITTVERAVYDGLWPTLCKLGKHGVLREDFAAPKQDSNDLRFPQDGRLVPGYAKDALAQLRTLTKCVLASSAGKAEMAKATS